MAVPKICFDRILPADLHRPQRMMNVGGRLRAVFEFRKRWLNGSTLKVRFLEGNSDQKAQVIEEANRWTQHANLNFDFGDAPDADIRITFDSNDGAWSYVGTDASSIPAHQATMNLGFLDRGTPSHEFGHAIGLGHEHQNPAGGITWNEAEVIRDLSGPPNNWTVAQIRHNVLNKYSTDQVRGTAFDPDSIMLYEFPARWTLNNVGTHGNDDLSAQDIAFIKSADAYPGRNGGGEPEVQAVELDVIDTAGVSASIGQPGEEDVFKFTVADAGRHTIETGGETDVFMSLFGPDSQTLKIAENDDGGVGRNSKIVADLGPGEYFVQIRHFNQVGGTGDYSIRVVR
ncbi:MAG: M12 family metallopeptidase [Acidimicrobiia bacterium]|nr:M12 family metallopeptidase [Acidimicrobiia bacterium]